MPFEVSVSAMAVPPSMVRFTVPVGVPVAAVTVIVKVSEALTLGALLDAETVVVVASKVGPVPELAGHAVARLVASTEPSPVTWS